MYDQLAQSDVPGYTLYEAYPGGGAPQLDFGSGWEPWRGSLPNARAANTESIGENGSCAPARVGNTLRNYLKTWHGAQPVIPAKTGIHLLRP